MSEFLANYNMPNFCSVILYDVKICEQVFIHNGKDNKMWKWDSFKGFDLKLHFSWKQISSIMHLNWFTIYIYIYTIIRPTIFRNKKICIIWNKTHYFLKLFCSIQLSIKTCIFSMMRYYHFSFHKIWKVMVDGGNMIGLAFIIMIE